MNELRLLMNEINDHTKHYTQNYTHTKHTIKL